MARILVYLDTREGLEGKMTLRWGSFSNAQLLDYEGVPFRCNKCRQIGHVYKDCPLIIGQEGRPKQSRPSAGGDSAPAPTPQRTSGRTIGARSSVHQSTPIPPASEHEHHRPASSPPLTRARAAAAAANISGTHPISCPITSDLSYAHFSSSACTMIQCDIPIPPPSISSGSPSLPFTSPPSSPSSSRSLSSYPYSLRPRAHRPDPPPPAGLGIVSLDPGFSSARGRKSNLSKAIKNASAEVAAGRQATITGVLRADYPPKSGPP